MIMIIIRIDNESQGSAALAIVAIYYSLNTIAIDLACSHERA